MRTGKPSSIAEMAQYQKAIYSTCLSICLSILIKT